MRPHRLLTLTFAALCAAAVLCAGAQAAAVPAYQQTASMLISQTAYARPSVHAHAVGWVSDTRPITGNQTVLPVIGRATVARQPWILVRLPQRPNGAVGWISANDVKLGQTPWHIVVDRGARSATIYDKGRVVRVFSVIVGRPSLPTPAGQFFVAEVVYEGYGIVTGPWALATSAYSNVLQEFDGGPGQVALHGVVGLSDPLGSATSHGCVRFSDQDITWLAQRATAGTPITIQ